ncbi:aldo/keto reductase [Mesonia aestuariivivens]|uniref:Aldo/keto reductase n=1 Tax=Mesonia aestuariivivens TaxID=2796128 RepID=A0ABS6VYS6_9FLAO|nr:aldo/keto reductase [Mesonia aestuariivivens]MBW2960735.1 aldo/keto reductase [Mesonia aestuariivivens]
MKTKKFGNSNLETNPIIFGGNVFGWTLDEKESFKLLDELFEKGYRTIDTADVYSRWAEGNQGGESEAILGKWMKERGVRDQISLHTKVGADMGQGHNDISKSYILKAAEDSLNRLQTDYIDLYYTHWDDNKTPVEETLAAYQKLINDGKVNHIGASNLSPKRLKESLKAAEEQSLPKYEVFQQQYNLVERNDFEGAIHDICVENGVGVSTYFSLASGFLTGKYRKEEDFQGKERKGFVEKYLNRQGLEILDTLDKISETHQVSNAAVALAWLMHRPGVTAPIASATKSSQLQAFDEALNLNLSDEEMSKLNEVSKK